MAPVMSPRPIPPTERRALAALLTGLLVGLGACGPPGELAGGVLHLDPRTRDGRSPAAVIAASRHATETALVPDPEGDGSADWRVEHGALVPAEGRPVQTLVPDEGAHAALVYRGSIDASHVDSLELELELTSGVSIWLTWAADGQPIQRRRRIELESSAGLSVQRFILASQPGWHGEVTDFRIEFAPRGRPRMELAAIRFVAGGLFWGYEPLDEEDPARESGDIGLVTEGYDARRAWPAAHGMPLFDRFRVPRGGVLEVAVAVGEPLVGTRADVTFAVDARRLSEDAETWTRLAERTVAPPPGEAQRAWQTLRADLGAFAGEEVEVRFEAAGGRVPPAATGGAALDERPLSGRYLWGSPLVLGELRADRRPNVLLVTIDTTRSDAVGGKGWTPNLDRLAERGILFEDACSTTNSTTPGHASILTGLMVQEHGAIGNRYALPAANATLAESFRAAGYHTAAVVSAFHIQAGGGFGQGFDRFQQARRESLIEGSYAADAVRGWIDEWSAEPRRPWFVWMHLFDPHGPYGPPKEFAAKYVAEHGITPPPLQASPPTIPQFDTWPSGISWLEGNTSREHVDFTYHLGVAYADHLVGRVLEAIERAGETGRTAVAVTADHGESLGEQDIWYCHLGLWRAVLEVPLVLALPDGPRGLRVAEPVTTMDIAPTLLAHAGLEVPGRMRGRDLVEVATEGSGGGGGRRRIWFQQSGLKQAGFRDDDSWFIATVDDDVFFITGSAPDEEGRLQPVFHQVPKGTDFLYDLREDPELLHDLAAERPDEAAARRADIERWLELMTAVSTERRNLSEEREQELRDLGYIGDENE